MTFELPKLPYDLDALEPYMSENTLRFHHGKHHRKYVDKLNELVTDSALANKSLDDIIIATAGDDAQRKVFNNAAQAWNHSFFWNCLTPRRGLSPVDELAEALAHVFGGLDGFKAAFKKAAVSQFGSGWTWLVVADGKLEITATPNAVNPIVHRQVPLLTCDVWEHAYYLDYQNRRGDFVAALLDHIVNWDFVLERLRHASQPDKSRKIG